MNALTMETPFGSFVMKRWPHRRNEQLRAWDNADLYLLQTLSDDVFSSQEALRIGIYNDAFGALSLPLHTHHVSTFSDSYLSQKGLVQNALSNGLPEDCVEMCDSLSLPGGPLDVVLFRVPKNLGLFAYQLASVRPFLSPSSRVFVTGMVKWLTSSVWELLEAWIGPTTTSRAWKKARMIEASFVPDLDCPSLPYPVVYPLEGTTHMLTNHANVFSRDSLDIGTRFFLQHLPVMDDARDIVDLGCGNGVVGMMAARSHPAAHLHFVDESHMAVASARETFYANLEETREASFVVGDALASFAPTSVDLILCNPPFHNQRQTTNSTANRMFSQARNVLRERGALWIVGNRHLGYHARLKQWFRDVSMVASNQKFVILCATDPR